jgi:hypothetical protein
MTNIDTTKIPNYLKALDCWVVWRLKIRRGKSTKVPYCAATGQVASSTDPATWSTFEKALAAYRAGRYSGIGFVFNGADGIVGIDLDKCRNPTTGNIETWAAEVVSSLETYTEVSPSGKGLHLYLLGKLPAGGRKKGPIEVYESGRYFTVTGGHLEETPLELEDRSDRLRAFHESTFGREKSQGRPNHSSLMGRDDEAMVKKARAAQNGPKFSRLYGGDWSDYPSQSEADMALCMILAFWCRGDGAQVDRLFRQSGLFRPKWDEPHASGGRTYGEVTVETASNRSTQTIHQDVPAQGDPRLPTVVVTDRPLQDMATDSLVALESSNKPPSIFVRSGALCRVRADENGRTLIEQVTEAQVRYRMARSAYFVKKTKYGFQHTPPPMDIVKDVMASGTWRFPALQGIVEVPVIRPDGTVLETPGYDSITNLIYCPAVGLEVPTVPTRPSTGQVDWALGMIEEVIGELPFADSASKTNAVATLLTPIVRPIITSGTPLALIEAPKAGTGKGLLSECISLIATGRSAAVMSAPDAEDEWRKRITSTLLEGATVITIDNLEGKLQSAALEGALTANRWKDRILGRSEMVTIPQLATWIATGNNISLGGDMPRRCFLVRLDAKVGRPWLRNEWRHPELARWVCEHRGELIAALLTLARAWYASDCPDYVNPRLGSFEAWSRVVGNIVSHAGLSGFLTNLNDVYQINDADGGQWEAFFEAWNYAFSSREITVAEVAREMAHNPGLRDVIPDWLADGYHREPGKFRKQFGEALARQRDAQYGPWRLERVGKDRRGVALWRVAQVNTVDRDAA